MTQPWLSPAELAAIQADVVGLVMVTAATIYHQTVNEVSGGSYEYGDDDVRYIGDTISGTPVEAQVWVVSQPITTAVDSGGMIQTVSPGMMRMPIGTSIFSGDEIAVGTQRFVAIDVHDDDTWPAWLLVTFRQAQAVYEP